METFVEDWGYLGVFLGIIATGLGFPMPEELPVVIGGALAVHDDVRWWVMLPVCIVGVIIGDFCLYFIGRTWGSRMVERPFFRRLLPADKMAAIVDNFHKYGVKILLFARLTPGVRAPIFLTAGISKMSVWRFVIADSIYAIPGVTILFFLSFFFTERMKALVKNKGEVMTILALVAIVAFAGYMAYRFFRVPVVTGEPGDVPRIMEPMSRGVDQVSNILHVTPREPKPEKDV